MCTEKREVKDGVCTWILLHDVEGFDGSRSQHWRQGGREAVALARQTLQTQHTLILLLTESHVH